MTPHRPCVVGFGELVWDVLPHATIPGGAPANFVWHAEQLGAQGALVSAVGDDAAGRDLLEWLRGAGLDASTVQVHAKPTGRVSVHVSERGEPGYVIKQDTAWDAIHWAADLANLARRADCVCFGSLAQRAPRSRETLYRFLAAVRPECIRVFDVNLRHPMPSTGVIEHSLHYTDVLKFNEAEWPFVAARLGVNADWSIGCRSLLAETDVRLIAVTRGARGSVLLTDDTAIELPAEPIEISDTIGAGDAFAATLAVGLLCRAPLRNVQQAAAKVSAFVCTQVGAMPRLTEALKSLLPMPAMSVRVPSTRLRSPSNATVIPAARTFDGEPAESH